MSKIVCTLLLLSWTVQGFVVPRQQQQQQQQGLQAAKGFKAKDTTPPKKKKESPSPTSEALVENISTGADDIISTPFPKREGADVSMGKAALEKLRRGRAEQRNAELQKVKDVQAVDAMMKETPTAAVIPEKVAQRMGARMLPFVGVPLFGGMALFVGFWYMATYKDVEFEPALVAAATIALLSVGLIGITYSIMSASWDTDREGTLLGTEEFSQNLGNIKAGLSRSRENERLREKMSEFSPEELSGLDSEVATKEKRPQSFSDKLGDDLE